MTLNTICSAQNRAVRHFHPIAPASSLIPIAPDAHLHNVLPPTEQQATGDNANEDIEAGATGTTGTAVPTTQTSSTSQIDGTWGERDVGGPVNHRIAMEEYEEMRRELTNLTQTSSRPESRKDQAGLFRKMTSGSAKSTLRTARSTRTTSTSDETPISDKDLEVGDAGPAAEKEEEFELGPFIKEGYFEKRTEAGSSAKKVGVVFKNLTVKGIGSTANYVRTLPNAILGTFGPDLYHIICNLVPALRFEGNQQMRTLTNDFTGIVRDGEMMLVLGRPGSGCTTFLKAIANQRGDYAEVTGNVSYGGIPGMCFRSLCPLSAFSRSLVKRQAMFTQVSCTRNMACSSIIPREWAC